MTEDRLPADDAHESAIIMPTSDGPPDDATPATPSGAPSVPDAVSPSGSLTEHQKFEIVRLHRSKLKGAKYNPRTLSAKARAKLKANIKRIGLVEPPIWNRRTGVLVGGHQRLSILDALEGKADYFLDVAVVDMDEKTEKETNLSLNNQELQGEWSLDALEKLIRQDIDVQNAGFDLDDIYAVFGKGEDPAVSADTLLDLSEQMRKSKELYKETKQANVSNDDPYFYMVVVFKDRVELLSFLDECGLPNERNIDGRVLREVMRNGGVKAGETRETREQGDVQPSLPTDPVDIVERVPAIAGVVSDGG